MDPPKPNIHVTAAAQPMLKNWWEFNLADCREQNIGRFTCTLGTTVRYHHIYVCILILVDFNLAVVSANRQSAKLNSPPNFPVIIIAERLSARHLLLVLQQSHHEVYLYVYMCVCQSRFGMLSVGDPYDTCAILCDQCGSEV